jgi:hypothetical protein
MSNGYPAPQVEGGTESSNTLDHTAYKSPRRVAGLERMFGATT